LTFGAGVAVGAPWNSNCWNWRTGAIYPPVWFGYPGWRPPYPGWRPGQPAWPGGRPGNMNIGNIGNKVNIGEGGIGNNLKPWRPGPDHRPALGGQPGVGANRPGGGTIVVSRPGGGITINVGGGNSVNPLGGGNSVNPLGGGNVVNSSWPRGGNAINVRSGNTVNPLGGGNGNAINIGSGNSVNPPGGGAVNGPGASAPAIPAMRPPPVVRPIVSLPGGSAIGGIRMGAGNAAFPNRGATSLGPISGVVKATPGGFGGVATARPGGLGGGAMARPGGLGGGYGGDGARHQ
jgi:hypothetical protein